METDREELIRKRAYELWEQAGQPEGGADGFWHQAEQELKDERRVDELLEQDEPRLP